MRTSLWAAVTAGAAVVGFLFGFVISTNTGVEPGFFELPEAGGYGAGPGGGDGGRDNLSREMEDYYKKLLE